VFKYLLEHAGTEFDPDVVKAFIEMMQRSETEVSQLPELPLAVPVEADLS
jgi:HD-GYP domain-containing protein (c-di-GMP phosphodiesterase class II)